MASSALTLPIEIRDLLTPPHLNPARRASIMPTTTPTPTSSRRNSIITTTTTTTTTTNPPQSTTTQTTTQSEFSLLLRRAAFTPGTKTSALIYNLEFREMIAFVRSLRPSEVAAVNKCGSLVLNLVIFSLRGAGVQRLVEWVELCELVGLGVEYRVQWTQFDAAQVLAVEGVLGRFREGRKVVKGLLGGREGRGRRRG